MTRLPAGMAAAAALVLIAAAVQAQTPAPPAPAPAAPAPAQAAAPAPAAAAPAQASASAAAPAKDSLSLYFDNGSAAIRPQDMAILDQAARLYRAGQPIVMILTASTDPTGSAIGNLALSQQRAYSVLRGLVARGIPAARFQILAKGETDLPVPAKPGEAQPQDRQVQIAWR